MVKIEFPTRAARCVMCVSVSLFGHVGRVVRGSGQFPPDYTVETLCFECNPDRHVRALQLFIVKTDR